MTTSALIGREYPADVLRAEVNRLVASHGGLVLVSGEAGIGKTALVTEAVRHARREGALVLSGSCWDSGHAPGYWPWVQITRALRRSLGPERYAGMAGGAGGGLATLLGESRFVQERGAMETAVTPAALAASDEPDAHSAGSPAETDAFDLYDAVTTALVTTAQERPVVVVLEDLHWADAASLRLLEFAVQHTWFERLLIIGTYRDAEVELAPGTDERPGADPGDGPPLRSLLLPLLSKATAVTLSGLTPEQVGELLTRSAGRDVGEDLAHQVHRRTGGNPFFVEQAARVWAGGGTALAVTPGVREVLRRRLALLPRPVHALLTTASVLGREFSRAVLAATAAAPAAQVDALLGQAISGRLVLAEGEGWFSFAHDLVRETLYEELDQEGARARHAAAVRAADRDPAGVERGPGGATGGPGAGPRRRVSPAEIARHAYLAGPALDPDRVVQALMAASEDAYARLAVDEGLRHLRRAREVAESPEGRRLTPARRVGVALELIGALAYQQQEPASERLLRETVELVRHGDDAELLARVALTVHGNHVLSRRIPELGAEILAEAHARLVLGGRGRVSERRLSSEDIAAELSLRSATLARGSDDDDALAFLLWARHDAIWGPGSAAEREVLTEELDAVLRRTGDHVMRHIVASFRWVAQLERGEPRFHEGFRENSQAIQESDLPSIQAAATVDRSVVAAFRGEFTEAEELLWSVEGEMLSYVPFAYLMRHQVWAIRMMRGQWPTQEKLTAELRDAHHPHPEILLGVSALESGDLCAARVHYRTVLEREPGYPRALRALLLRFQAQMAAVDGDLPRIEELHAELTPYAGQWLVSLYGAEIDGPVRLWLGVLDAARGRWDEAVAELTEVRRSAVAMGSGPWEVRCVAWLAEVLIARARGDDSERGEELRAETDALASHYGMEPVVEQARTAGPNGPSHRRAETREESVGPAAAGASDAGAGPGGRSVTHPAPGAPAPTDPAGTSPPRTGPAAAPSPTAGERSAQAPVAGGPQSSAPLMGVFRRSGAVWELGFGERTLHSPDAKGLRDLHHLLARPGSEVAAVRLLAPEGGELVVAARGFGGDDVLDEEAKARYKHRLDLLDEEIDRAVGRGDDARAEEYDGERRALLEQLRSAAGLAGRTRRLGDEAERARKTVTARIRDTLRKLDDRHPELAAHLRGSVSTGAYCRYLPERPVEWRL